MKARWILLVSPPVFLLVAIAVLWPGPFDVVTNPYVGVGTTFYVAGAVLVVKAVRNRIGWLLLIFRLLGTAGTLSEALSTVWEGHGTMAACANTIGAALSTASIVGLPLVLMYFPDGRLSSIRWKAVSSMVVLAGLAGFGAALLNGGWGGDSEAGALPSPIREATAPAGDVASTVFS